MELHNSFANIAIELHDDCAGAVICVPDLELATKWICKHLFFEEKKRFAGSKRRILINGDCILYLVQGEPVSGNVWETELAHRMLLGAKGVYGTGLAHIALHTADIDQALDWCKAGKLNLLLDGEGSFFNPGVFGGGERYFNIISPFGVTFEVSEQINQPVRHESVLINGLDHLGIPCGDIGKEMQFLEGLGFKPLFEMVYNFNEKEGHISCGMVSDGTLTLEVYQFTDQISYQIPPGGALAGIAYGGMAADSPGGVHFIEAEGKEETEGMRACSRIE